MNGTDLEVLRLAVERRTDAIRKMLPKGVMMLSGSVRLQLSFDRETGAELWSALFDYKKSRRFVSQTFFGSYQGPHPLVALDSLLNEVIRYPKGDW
jgi:isocitrate lyase